MSLPHRPHKVTPRCSECSEALSYFEGEWFCPNCVSYWTVPELVHLELACPTCKERRMDCLGWLDDETVCCSTCGTRYEPGKGVIERN
jgi:hypothetical protein